MQRYGSIIDGKVVAVVEQATPPAIPGLWVELTATAGPEDKLESGSFVRARSDRLALIRGDALRSRLTEAEESALEVAMADNPGGTSGARTAAADLRVWVRRTVSTRVWDLRQAATQTWLERLQTAGIIASGRAAAIVAGSVSEAERP